MFALFHAGRVRKRTARPEEIASDVYSMEVGAGIMRSNMVYDLALADGERVRYHARAA